jgi:hypothetical protein
MLGGIALLAAPLVEAQQWGRPNYPRTGACFFRDKDFEGDYFCERGGSDISVLPSGMNDQISSIRTFGGAEVVLFQNTRFDGRSTEFRGDVRNLRDEGWNDRISSVRVRKGYASGSNGNAGQGYGSSGQHNGNADVIVRRAYDDILHRKPDSDGLRLYRSRIVDDGWSEQDVREALRKSPEYRELSTMTRQKAEDIVARAYHSVLNREPDSGSRGYVDKVMRDHWTEQDVARELRKSPEYRNANKH